MDLKTISRGDCSRAGFAGRLRWSHRQYLFAAGSRLNTTAPAGVRTGSASRATLSAIRTAGPGRRRAVLTRSAALTARLALRLLARMLACLLARMLAGVLARVLARVLAVIVVFGLIFLT